MVNRIRFDAIKLLTVVLEGDAAIGDQHQAAASGTILLRLLITRGTDYCQSECGRR